ncbi:MAG TPA: hypothetical protein PKK48_00855 [Phycisphaerae bacterium]|nr:hypothetical protein [Phycisphaerae bacterium]
MSETCEEHEHCKESFDILFKKIDKLDEAIRGNGKPGILIRLDRLEQAAGIHSKLIWLILGAIGTFVATAVAMWITG